MAAIPGYKEGCSSVGQTPYENLSCGVLSVVSTMVNSLIAVVSYCLHCKVCMHLYKLWNMHFLHCTCTVYLHMICCILIQCVTHTQSVSYCKTIMQDHARYTVVRQSSMLKSALFPCSQSAAAFCWHCQ